MVEAGRTRAGRSLGSLAPELVASMRPRCPWREVEAAQLQPEVPGRLDGEDVGFVSPGHCPGCEQEEAAAHPGRPHPGEWPGSAAGPVTLVHLRPARGGYGCSARHGRATAWARSAAAAHPPPRDGKINKSGRGCFAVAGARRTTFPIRPRAAACWGGDGVRARPPAVRGVLTSPGHPLGVFVAAVLEAGGCLEVRCGMRLGD